MHVNDFEYNIVYLSEIFFNDLNLHQNTYIFNLSTILT